MTLGARTRMQLALLRADLRGKNHLPPFAFRLSPWGLIAFLLFAFGLVGHLDLEAERAALGDHPSPPIPHPSTKIEIDLRECTPPGVPLNDQLDIAIQPIGDRFIVTGCTRYAAGNRIPTDNVIIP